MLEKQFGHKQKQKDEDEVVEEKTLLHSELQDLNELLLTTFALRQPGQATCTRGAWLGVGWSSHL